MQKTNLIQMDSVIWELSCLNGKGIFNDGVEDCLKVSEEIVRLVFSYRESLGLENNCNAKDLYEKLEKLLESQVKN